MMNPTYRNTMLLSPTSKQFIQRRRGWVTSRPRRFFRRSPAQQHARVLPDDDLNLRLDAPQPQPGKCSDEELTTESWTDLLEVVNRERVALEGERSKTLNDLGEAVKRGARQEVDTVSRFVGNLRGAILKLVVPKKKE